MGRYPSAVEIRLLIDCSCDDCGTRLTHSILLCGYRYSRVFVGCTEIAAYRRTKSCVCYLVGSAEEYAGGGVDRSSDQPSYSPTGDSQTRRWPIWRLSHHLR